MTRSTYLALGGGIAAALLCSAAPAYAWQQIQWDGQTVWADPWTSSTALTWSASQPGVWDTIYFNGKTSGGQTIPGLWSSVTLTLGSVSTVNGVQGWTFDYSIFNASKSPMTNSLVTDFVFDEDGKIRNSRSYPDRITGGFNTISSVNNYATTKHWPYTTTYDDSTVKLSDTGPHGATSGVAQGQTDSGTFTLYLDKPISDFVLTDPLVDYQYPGQSGGEFGLYSLSYDCGGGGSTNKTGLGTPVGWVPEPGTWALMLGGFFGVGAIVRKRRQETLSPAAV